MKKNLIKIAHKIVELEKEVQNTGTPGKSYFVEMEKLMFGLSIKDMIEIDNYIQENNLLTKQKFYDTI